MVKPSTVANAAVRKFHTQGAPAARSYLRDALRRELNHKNPSQVGNANNTLHALDNYIAADHADGRRFVGFGQKVLVALPHGTVRTTVQVIVEDVNRRLAGRAVFFDAPPMSLAEAEITAYAYARAMQLMYPGRTVTDVCVWQVRRNNIHAVPMATALARLQQADAVLSRL